MSSNMSGIAPSAQANGARHRIASGPVDGGNAEHSPPAVSASVATLGNGGGATKSLEEHFQVDTIRGSLTTSFAVRTSPGRGGFGPQLALTYDSNSGNGPFGLGWNLGLSVISRKTATQIPQYNDGDVFVLSGADDLLPIEGSKLATIRHKNVSRNYLVETFRPRTDDMSRKVERWTRQDDAEDVHWRAISNVNHCSIYGFSDAFRIFDPHGQSKRIFSWLLCRSYDTKGNAIRYHYTAEDGHGLPPVDRNGEGPRPCLTQKYLTSISYGNLKPARDLDSWDIVLDEDGTGDWTFEVVFDYHVGDPASTSSVWDVRKDPFSRFNAGFEVRTLRLCRRICMVHNFPGESPGGNAMVVSTTEIEYQESAKGSFITSLRRCGYSSYPGSDGVALEWEPPTRFEYSSIPSPDTVQPQAMPGVMQTNGSSKGGRWIDLEGEGAPGYLAMGEDGRWTFQRNLNAACMPGLTFDAPSVLSTLPSEAQRGSRTSMFVDLDQNGNLDLVYFDDEGRAEGFVERRSLDHSSPSDERTWCAFEPFQQVPMAKFPDTVASNRELPAVHLIDLTGSGAQDLLMIDKETDEVVWYESLAKAGYGPAARRCAAFRPSTPSSLYSASSSETGDSSPSSAVSSVSDESSFLDSLAHSSASPWIVSGQPDKIFFSADMTGDGLADLVLVSNGSVVYWPNMGYGQFGSKRTMANAPLFDHPQQFTVSRLLFADVDGTGTADILYLPARGGVDIYYNCLGNSWKDVVHVSSLPRIDDTSTISALDILGDGTSCLVWIGPDTGNTNQSQVWYLPLMNGTKPHLMTGISNGMGLETTVQYRPSTFFRQRDLLASRPWKASIPSAMHCVSEICTQDHIALGKTWVSYSYHDGFYDHTDSAFGGYGMVEMTRAKSVQLHGQLVEMHRTTTKTWFHTGSVFVGSEHFNVLCPARLDAEKRYGDIAARHDNPQNIYRALRGRVLRQETYQAMEQPNTWPSVVEESTFDLRLLEQGTDGIEAFAVIARETVQTEFDTRALEEPRISHSVTVEVDDYLNTTKSLVVNYGKVTSDLSNPADRAKQEETVITSFETRFTDAFTETPGTYVTPRRFQEATWRVFGIEKPPATNDPARTGLHSSLDLGMVFDASRVPVLAAEESAVAMRNKSSFSPHKVLTSCTRTTYWSNALTGVLGLGTAELYSVPDRTYQLCLTPGMVSNTYLSQKGLDPGALVDAGYVDLDGDGHWWIPTGTTRYRKSTAAASQGSPTELQAARASFWTPTVTVDAFGNESSHDLDEYCLLITASTDPMNNTTNKEWDYRHLQPVLVTDINGNRKATMLSPLGEVAATAIMGKSGELLGDSLDGLRESSSDSWQAVMDDFYNNPTQSSALALLGSASQRVVNNRCAYQLYNTSESTTPAWQATVSRVSHMHSVHEPGDLAEELQGGEPEAVIISFTFFDGQRRPLQTSVQLGDGTWKVDTTILDTDGQEIIKYRPSIQSSHRFNHPSILPANSLGHLSFLDFRGRLVGRLHPDHTWTKTVFSPWSEVVYDANDVALVEDPSKDAAVGHFFRALGDRTLYEPTWFQSKQQEAASLGPASAASAVTQQVINSSNTPRSLHRDVLGRVFLTRDESGSTTESLRTTYDVYGVAAACAVYDAMGRLTEVSKVDMMGRTIDRVGADYGRRTTLLDVHGIDVRAWSSGGISVRKTYDALRRLNTRWVAEDKDGMHSEEKLVEKLMYGEEMSGDLVRQNNLAGVVCEHLDQAGRAVVLRADFKGNVTHSSRQLAVEFRKTIDWQDIAAVRLEDEVFEHKACFDALGRLRLSKDASGCTTKQAYDSLGQVSEVHLKDRDGKWTRLSRTEYDAHGHETLIEHGSHDVGNGTATTTTTTLEYDPRSLTLIRKKIVASTAKAGKRTTKILLDENYHRDCLQRIVHQTDDAQLDMWNAGNRVRPDKSFVYDAFGRLVQATGRAHVRAGYAGAGMNVQDGSEHKQQRTAPTAMYEYIETYTYNAAGNMVSLRHQPKNDLKSAGVAQWTRKYFYEEESCLGPASSIPLANIFPYIDFAPPGPPPPSAAPLRVYNNRLSRTQVGRISELVQYDASTPGGAHGCPSSLSRWSSLTWNYAGLLRSSAAMKTSASPSNKKKNPRKAPVRTWYVYDGSGTQRVRKVTERENEGGKIKETIYLDGVEIFRRFSPQRPALPASPDPVPTTIKSERITVYGKASHAVVELWADSAGTERSLMRHQVHHGLELDPDGNVISQEEYSPFGRTVCAIRSRKDITAPRRYRFAGYQRDLETGLYYCQARYYAPWLGRWLTSDPIFSADGLDTYAYCSNDPVNHEDPKGTAFAIWTAGATHQGRAERAGGTNNGGRLGGRTIQRRHDLPPTDNGGRSRDQGNRSGLSTTGLTNQSTRNAQAQPKVNTEAISTFHTRHINDLRHYHGEWVQNHQTERRNDAEETRRWWAEQGREGQDRHMERLAERVKAGEQPISSVHAYWQYLAKNSEGRHEYESTLEGHTHRVIERELSQGDKENLAILQQNGGSYQHLRGNVPALPGAGNGNAPAPQRQGIFSRILRFLTCH